MASIANIGDVVLLIAPDRRRYLLSLQAGAKMHTHRGWVAHDDLIGQPLGRTVLTQKGAPFLAVEPSTYDLIRYTERQGQIIFPKDAAQIVLRLNLFAGRRVIEAGTGSGGLTLALARSVWPSGRVYSYEARDDMQRQARRTLERLGLASAVDLKLRDIAQGFDETEVDALFLDVREPWLYLAQALAALKQGGFFGSLVPTTQQVSDLLAGLAQHAFGDVVVEELLVRPWKTVPERLRPADRMVAHTGYLIFARALNAAEGDAWWAPDESRRAQQARQRRAWQSGHPADDQTTNDDREGEA